MKKINKKGHKFIVFWVLISFLPLFVTCGGPGEESSRPQEPSVPSKPSEPSTPSEPIPNNFYRVIYDKNAVDATGTMAYSDFYYSDYNYNFYNLRINNFVRNNYFFIGWAKTSASTTAEYTDGQKLTENLTTAGNTITLYAVWHEAYTVEVTAGSTLAEKFTWITNNAESYTTYIIEINNDDYNSGASLSYGAKKYVSINLKGNGSITNNNSYSSLFMVNSGVTLILDGNITLLGDSSSSLISVYGGYLIMNGGKISTSYSYPGKSGVYVASNGTFTMNGGEISGITNRDGGGGVYVASNGTFTMNGGEIFDNTTINGGGGVCLTTTNNLNYIIIFNKTGGTITGSNSTNSNIVKDSYGNIVNNKGRAIFIDGGSDFEKRKETTAGPGDNLSFSGTYEIITSEPKFIPSWSGAWDY